MTDVLSLEEMESRLLPQPQKDTLSLDEMDERLSAVPESPVEAPGGIPYAVPAPLEPEAPRDRPARLAPSGRPYSPVTTGRYLDRTWRPDIAAEQEYRPENLMYGQLTVAQKRMRTINRDMTRVIQAPTLEDTRDLAQERARLTRDMPLLMKARRKKVWNDMGALKRLLKDDLLRERNTFAKRAMGDVRERETELRVVP